MYNGKSEGGLLVTWQRSQEMAKSAFFYAFFGSVKNTMGKSWYGLMGHALVSIISLFGKKHLLHIKGINPCSKNTKKKETQKKMFFVKFQKFYPKN